MDPGQILAESKLAIHRNPSHGMHTESNFFPVHLFFLLSANCAMSGSCGIDRPAERQK